MHAFVGEVGWSQALKLEPTDLAELFLSPQLMKD